MGNSTKELVNAFNLSNYFSDKNTNFTVEDKKIFGLFASSTNIGEYLQRIGEKIIKRHYLSRTEVAGAFYNLNCFPFVLGANPDKEYLSNGIVKVKLADSTNNEVIRNLKVHFANEFKKAVISKVVARLKKAGIMEEEAYEWIEKTVKIGVIGSPYLYCIAFSGEYLKRKYDSETFEVLKGMYIQEFNSRLKECGLKSSDFYEYKDDMLYIKDVSDKVVKSVAEYVRGRVALDFRTPGSIESKVENCKNVLSELILEATGKFVDGYDYDDFTDEKKIKNGHSFVLIPFIEENGQLKSLSSRDASKINRAFNKEMPNGFIDSNFISDIRGKTANPQFANCKEPVYAFSNKQIALLLPMIMESPIAYNERNGRFEFAVDLENFKRRGSSRSSSTVTSPFNSPTHAEPPRTPPNQRKADSGYDSSSPPKPKDSGSSSGDPRSLFEQPQTQQFPTRNQNVALKDSPRQGFIELSDGLRSSRQVDGPGTSEGFWPSTQLSSTAVNQHAQPEKCVNAAANVPASTNLWTQQPNPWSLQSTSGSKCQPLPEPGPSGLSWKGTNKSGSAWTSQPIGFWSSPAPSAGFSSWKGAQAGANISEKEKELFEKLLYTLNLMNYTLGGVHTNFFAKDGKIVSLLHDNVDREEYFQVVRDYIIEEYYGDEEEARKLYDFNEFPFKLNCEEKQEKTVVANISSGALSNLKILFSQKFGKSVDAIDISAVKKVEEREKDEWVDRQLLNKDSLEEACENCFPDEGLMKRIPIALEGDEYVLDRSRDIREVELLLKEQLRRLRDTSVAGKGESDNKPLTEEEKELFKALLYAFNYSNHDFDLPDTNFIVKNGKIASLIPDSVNVKEYLQEVRDKTKKEYCKDKKEAYDLDEFPFKFLSNCKKNQETTVVAEISRGALFNLEKLFIYGYKEEVKIEKIDINIVKEAVKSRKHRLVERKAKEGIERKAGHYSRIKPYEAATASYPDESALEGIPIIEDKGGYCLDRTYEPSETKLFVKDLGHTEDRSKAGKVKPEDNKDSGISSGEATDAENVSSKAEATTSSGYESMDCENPPTSDQGNAGGGSPKRKSEEPLEGSPTKRLSRSGSSNSSSEKEGGSPHQGLIDPTLEQVRKRFDKACI